MGYNGLPSGELTYLWNITIFHEKIHYKWPFSIAMLVHQRVMGYNGLYPYFLGDILSIPGICSQLGESNIQSKVSPGKRTNSGC